MAFLDKFKKKDQTEQPPSGVDLEYSSFNYQKNENTFQPQTIPEPRIQTKATVPPIRQKGRPGGGWEDEAEDDQPKSFQPAQTIPQVSSIVPSTNQPTQISAAFEPPKKVYEAIQLSRIQTYTPYQVLTQQQIDAGSYEYESSVVLEATRLGGMRLKQSDAILKNFGQVAENLQEQLIGSLLLNQLHEDDNWKVQTRVLYAIDYLCQNVEKYKKYFENNLNRLNLATTQPQLQQILDQVKADLQGKVYKHTQDAQFDFIEPPKAIVQQSKPPVQKQENILEFDASPKKNAFQFLKGSTKSPIQDQVTDLLDQQSTTQMPQVQESKKANSFGFLKKTQQPEQQQIPAQPQYAQPKQQNDLLDASYPEATKVKPNSFQFIKKAQSTPQDSNNLLNNIDLNGQHNGSQQPNSQQPYSQQPNSQQPNSQQPNLQVQQQLPYYQQTQYPAQYPPQFPQNPQYQQPYPQQAPPFQQQQQQQQQNQYSPQQYPQQHPPQFAQQYPQQPYNPAQYGYAYGQQQQYPQQQQQPQQQQHQQYPHQQQFQYPPGYAQQQGQPLKDSAPLNRSSEELKMFQEKKKAVDESAFDFIKI